MLRSYVADWLNKCPTHWDYNDLIEGSLWIIVHDAVEPEEEEEEEEDV